MHTEYQTQSSFQDSSLQRQLEVPKPKRVTNFSVQSLLDLNVSSPADSGYSSSASPNPEDVTLRMSSSAENRPSREHIERSPGRLDVCSSPDSAVEDVENLKQTSSNDQISESAGKSESFNLFQAHNNLNALAIQAQLYPLAPFMQPRPMPFSPADMYWMQLGRLYWEQALLSSGYPGHQSLFVTPVKPPPKCIDKAVTKCEDSRNHLPEGRLS